jgi:hypothetical protein
LEPSLPLILIGLSLIFSIALCVHVVRTGQQMYWLMIILLFQPLGGLVYLVAIIAPEFLGGAKAQKARQAARKAWIRSASIARPARPSTTRRP